MKLIIDIPDTQYNNIMEVKSMCLGRLPYKGIIMNAIKGIKNGTPYTEFGTYIDGYMKGSNVLDKIRAEIEDLRFGQPLRKLVVDECLDIIDKYREGEQP